MTGRRVVLAVTGGIAAYKAADLCSRLVRGGAAVRVVMTDAATRFVTPLTFRTLSGQPVVTDLWTDTDQPGVAGPPATPAPSGGPETIPARSPGSGSVSPPAVIHVALADFAEVLVIAPATADILGKMVAGIADEVVSTLTLSVDVPIIVAPAMNTRMWENAAVQYNLQVLRERGVTVVGPTSGRLACGTTGMGRLAENDDIIEAVRAALGA